MKGSTPGVVVTSFDVSDGKHHHHNHHQQQQERSTMSKWCHRLWEIYEEYELLVLFVVAIVLAKAYPKLGAEYLAPHITATWMAVVFIFLVAGLGLKTEEFESASKEVHFIIFIQTFNFGVVPLLVFGLSRFLMDIGVLVDSLADGMVICACLPMAVNLVLLLTKTSGGDEAAAILNSTLASIVGVFLSPLMILGYLGVSGGVDLGNVFYKLAIRIVFPLIVGQIIHKTSTTAVQWMKTYARVVKKSQIFALVFIIYTVFCTTFIHGTPVDMSSIVLVFFLQILLVCALTSLAWFSLQMYFPDKPKLRVMGLFGCTHKTISVGVPLINAMYEGNVNAGLYTLPLLMWHPLQLVVGSILAPRLSRFVEREQKRLRTLPTISSVVPMVHRTTTATTTHDDDKLAVVNEHTPLVIHGNHVTETTSTSTTTTTTTATPPATYV